MGPDNNQTQRNEEGESHLISPQNMSGDARQRFAGQNQEKPVTTTNNNLPEGSVVIKVPDIRRPLAIGGGFLLVAGLVMGSVAFANSPIGRNVIGAVEDIALAKKRREEDGSPLPQILPTTDVKQHTNNRVTYRNITDETNVGTQAEYNALLASAVGGVRTENTAETGLDTQFTQALEVARAQINEQLKAELAGLYKQHGNLLTPINPNTPIEVQGKQSFSWLSFLAGDSEQLRSLPEYLQAQAACDQIITEFFSKNSPEPNAWLDFISTDLKRYGIDESRESLRDLMITELSAVITPEGNTQTAGLFELGQLPAIQEHVKNGGNLLNASFSPSEYSEVFGSYHPSTNKVHQFRFSVGNHEEAPDNLRYNRNTKMLVVMFKEGNKTVLLSGRWDCGLNMHVDVFEGEIPTPTFTPTNAPTSFNTVTLTPTPSDTPITVDTGTPTPTDTPTTVDTVTVTPTPTPSDTPVTADTGTPTPTDTPTIEFTPTPTVTPTNTPLPTKEIPTTEPTDTTRPTATNEPTSIPTNTNTPQPPKPNTPVPQSTNTPQPPTPSEPVYTPVPDGGSTPAPPGPPPSSLDLKDTGSDATMQTADANIGYLNALVSARKARGNGLLPSIAKVNVRVKVNNGEGKVVFSQEALASLRDQIRPLNTKLANKTITAGEEAHRLTILNSIKELTAAEKSYKIYLSEFEAYAWKLSNGNHSVYNQLVTAAQDSLLY